MSTSLKKYTYSIKSAINTNMANIYAFKHEEIKQIEAFLFVCELEIRFNKFLYVF